MSRGCLTALSLWFPSLSQMQILRLHSEGSCVLRARRRERPRSQARCPTEARKETAALRPHLPGGTACASCPQAPELFLPADMPWEDGPPGNRETAGPHVQAGYSLTKDRGHWTPLNPRTGGDPF